ncbi:MAG: DUF4838 domain-containing protein, partial [Bacteroidetes bacterium]|nr:DUF4838 domain-containing protein [Bacteroidota bacterium]
MRTTAFLLLLASLLLTSCQQGINIAQNGKSSYTVIIPQEAGKTDSTAASYLSKYISEMTEAGIPVLHDSAAPGNFEICIGNTNRFDFSKEELSPDAYIIRSMDEKLFIVGGDRKGTIYGVIDLLEQWGCRKFSPDASHIPKYDHLDLDPIDRYNAPANDLRIINGKMTANPEFVDWLRVTTIPEVSPPGYYVHTFHRLIPREEFFADHPEYFAWLGNKYSFDQPCPSNPEVKNLIIERLALEMEKYPDYDIWSVSQNDNFTYCRCDKCEKIIEEEGSPAGPIIRLVNDVAAHFPEKTIATLAYQFSRTAPLKTKPADNVLV